MAEMMEQEYMEEDVPVEEPMVAEEPAAPPEDTGAGTVMRHTVDDIPELAQMGIGDTLTLQVMNITDTGEYELGVVTEAAAPSQGGGQAAVEQALMA